MERSAARCGRLVGRLAYNTAATWELTPNCGVCAHGTELREANGLDVWTSLLQSIYIRSCFWHLDSGRCLLLVPSCLFVVSALPSLEVTRANALIVSLVPARIYTTYPTLVCPIPSVLACFYLPWTDSPSCLWPLTEARLRVTPDHRPACYGGPLSAAERRPVMEMVSPVANLPTLQLNAPLSLLGGSCLRSEILG